MEKSPDYIDSLKGVLNSTPPKTGIFIGFQNCRVISKVAEEFIIYGYDEFVRRAGIRDNYLFFTLLSGNYITYHKITNSNEYLDFFAHTALSCDKDATSCAMQINIYHDIMLIGMTGEQRNLRDILVTIGSSVASYSYKGIDYFHVLIPIGLARIPRIQAKTRQYCNAIFPAHIEEIPDMVARQIRAII